MRELTRAGVATLVPYPPGKPIEELERELGIKNSIKLASNENPIGPSPKAMEAIGEALGKLHRYPDGSGYYLKRRLSRLHAVPEEQIVLGNGSNEVIELLVRTFLLEGETALQAFPSFLVYQKMVQAAGGKMQSVALCDFQVNLEAMAAAVRPETKLLFLTNPNNPTGQWVHPELLCEFLAQLPPELIVVLDEAYVEFVPGCGLALDPRPLNSHPHVCVLRTFSKLFGLAGLRIGYGIASSELSDYLNRVRQPFNVNSLAQVGALAALDDEDFVKCTLRQVADGLDYLYGALEQMELSFVKTSTNFFLIQVPGGGRRVYEDLLREGVIVRSMESYGLPEFIRINVGLKAENERFIASLKKVLARYGEK